MIDHMLEINNKREKNLKDIENAMVEFLKEKSPPKEDKKRLDVISSI